MKTMEHIDVLNLVNAELYRAKSTVSFQIKKMQRLLEYLLDKSSYIKDCLLKIDYEKSAFGHYYINCNYDIGETRIDIRERMARYYENNLIFVRMDYEEKNVNIKTDSYNFFVEFELEQELKKQLEIICDDAVQPHTIPTENTPEPQRWENLLPDGLRTDEAVNVFNKAIEADLMEVCGDRLKWKKSKALLAYFLGHFLVNGVFLDKEFSTLFNESRLSQAYYRLADNKHGGGKPRGYDEIDRLFEQP